LRTDNLTAFFENIKKTKRSGCSFVLQINLCDEYIPYWEEIKRISIENTGALPQVALTRGESCNTYTKVLTNNLTEYFRVGKEMNSPLFDFTCKNFMVKRKEFCYAGEWSAKLNIGTGEMTGCYGNGIKQNIFNDLNKPIKFKAIGNNCCFKFCFNSSHFMSLGVIPSLETPSYGDLRNRKDAKWYTKSMEQFFSERLYNNNDQYSDWGKLKINIAMKLRRSIYYPLRFAAKIKRKLFK